MNLDRYAFHVSGNNEVFIFWSDGPKGLIMKAIAYQKLSRNNYNLAFGNWNEKEQKIDHLVRSNNGDAIKVMATVLIRLLCFCKSIL